MEGLRPEDPRRIGDHRLLGRLGAGGMGRVYLGRSSRGRTVAVKLVHPELARDPDFRRRFRNEVAAARRVGGEWTAPVLDADTESDTPWVATGYVPGPTLQQTVDRHGPLPEPTVLALAAGLARALRAVHACDLIHRDLKPSNVLITIDGPRVIDFGIARSVDASVATRTGALIGSPGYMSPEQVRGEPLTAASDIFCLGSVLAFAALGRPPFGSGDSGLHALLFRVAQEEADLGDLTGPIQVLADACLAKDPGARPALDEVLAAAEKRGPGMDEGAWLPAAVVTELGRHAAGLLDLENPEAPPLAAPRATPPPRTTPPPSPSPVPPPPLSGSPAGPSLPPMAPPPMGRPSSGPHSFPHGVTQAPAGKSAPRLYLGIGAAAVAAVTLVALILVLTDGEGKSTAGQRPRPPRVIPPDAPVEKGAVPASLLGTWEGTVRKASTGSEWVRRITVKQGEVGEQVAQVRSVAADEMCEFTAELLTGGPSVNIRTSPIRSVPAGMCGKGANQTMTPNSDGTVYWASANVNGTLARVKEQRVPERYRGRWWATTTDDDGKNPVRREFDFGDGEIGAETVTIDLSSEKTACEARAVLVSAERSIVIFSVRIAKQTRGRCNFGTMQKLVPQGDGGLHWQGVKGANGTALQRP